MTDRSPPVPGAAGLRHGCADLAAAAAVMEVPRVVAPAGLRRAALRGPRPVRRRGADGPDLLYIQKNEGLRRHAGQPAFPGGKIEDSDDGPVGAALREAAEETGLDPGGRRRARARCPSCSSPRSQFRVVPVLAWWRVPSAVRPVDIGEVAAVERISVADLADPANRLMLRFPERAQRSGVPHRLDADLGFHRADH